MWATLSNQLMTCLDQKADLPTPNWERGNSPAHCLQTSSATAPLPASPEDCLWIWTASLLSLSPAYLFTLKSLSCVRLPTFFFLFFQKPLSTHSLRPILNPKATSDLQSWKQSLLPLNFKSILCGSFMWFSLWHIWLFSLHHCNSHVFSLSS